MLTELQKKLAQIALDALRLAELDSHDLFALDVARRLRAQADEAGEYHASRFSIYQQSLFDDARTDASDLAEKVRQRMAAFD